ncbi:hypothetical protein H7K04_07250 [Mycolicibacterium fluoranthenivorans]|nr:hypothetical protein [Mycolicibacterium fluoranthenivorans]
MTSMTRLMGTAFGITAAAALAFAASAQADPLLLNGTYAGGDAENVWTIASTCGVIGCTGSVASNQGWTSPMTLTDGRWNFSVTKPDGFICDDGSYQPAVISISVDPATLGGVVSADSNGACPGGILSQTPFQLRQV